MNYSLLLKQVKKNKITAEQLIYLLQKDENAMNAYEDDVFAHDFLGDLHGWSTKQIIHDYYHQGLVQNFGENSVSVDELSPMITEVDLHPYEQNLFYQTIQWPTVRLGEWAFDWGVFPAYQLFLLGDVTVDENQAFAEKTPLGFSRKPFLYPCLLKADSIWMSVTPFEIETMSHVIKEAFGNVLTLGCGMGYVAFMMSEKKEVKSITIVEKDQHVLSMFEQHILPQFPHRHKINLIHQDAFDYLNKEVASTTFDMVFVDIYQTVDDGLPLYLKLKKIEARMSHTKPWFYWLEESMLALIRRQWIERRNFDLIEKGLNKEALLNALIRQLL